jgi:hypothetical protein
MSDGQQIDIKRENMTLTIEMHSPLRVWIEIVDSDSEYLFPDACMLLELDAAKKILCEAIDMIEAHNAPGGDK